MSSESDKKADATRLLKEREGDVAKGMPITADIGKIRFGVVAVVGPDVVIASLLGHT